MSSRSGASEECPRIKHRHEDTPPVWGVLRPMSVRRRGEELLHKVMAEGMRMLLCRCFAASTKADVRRAKQYGVCRSRCESGGPGCIRLKEGLNLI